MHCGWVKFHLPEQYYNKSNNMINGGPERRFRRVVADGGLGLFESWLIYLSREHGGLLSLSLLIKTDFFGHHTYSSILAYVAFHAIHRLADRMIDMIISQGFSINFQDGNGDTALHYAVSANNHFAVSALLACPGIDPNIQGLNRLSPLMLAVSGGDQCIDIVRSLLASGRMDLSLVDDNGENVHELANEVDEEGKDVCALLYLYWQMGGDLFRMSQEKFLRCEELLQEYVGNGNVTISADNVVDYLGDLLGLNNIIAPGIVPDSDFLAIAGRPSSEDHCVPDINDRHDTGPRP